MPRGYAGRLLRVDLTTGSFREEPLKEELMRDYIGGNGFAARILYDELKPGIDPLGPENKLLILTGPLTGTAAPSSGRWAAYAKSPVTTAVWGEAHCGGTFGPELKYAGFDGIIFEGRAEKPVYLWIDSGKYELKDAAGVWGRDVFETERLLKEEVGDETVKIISIGPAGEKLVRIACITDSLYRVAGRCGLGAVMGSKNLKAVVARGELDIEVEDPDGFEEACGAALSKMKEAPVTGTALPMYGTQVLTAIINEHGIYPTNNFRDSGALPGYEAITGETMRDTILIKNRGCRFCWIRCARYTAIRSGPYAGCIGEGPEYETVWAFGGQCGITRLDAITYANWLCNKYGIDTISAGNLIGWAMELYEKGLITKEGTGGIDLRFGNWDAMVEMTEAIALRRGFGDVLAEGWLLAAKKIGKGSERFIMGVKGLGLPAYDPRGVFAHGLGYATSSRGGCHLRAYMIAPEILGIPEKLDPLTTEGKAKWTIAFQDGFAVVDSLIICKFVTFGIWMEDIAPILSAATGFKYTADGLMKIGERIWNLERAIMCREGIRRKDDTLPERCLKEPMPVGAAKGRVVPLEPMLDEYYELRGWDKEAGIPTPEKLRELGLSKAAEDMERLLAG